MPTTRVPASSTQAAGTCTSCETTPAPQPRRSHSRCSPRPLSGGSTSRWLLATAPSDGSRRPAGQRVRGGLDGGGDMNEGGPVRHRTEAEADWWLDHVEPAQLAAGERGVGGDDAVEVAGAVSLAAPVAGAAAGADTGQQPAGGEVQQGHPPGGPRERGRHEVEQPAQQAATPGGEREPQGAG